jgi:hypothetical protein
MLPNLAKDTYGWSSLEQHYKIEKIKNNIYNTYTIPNLFIFFNFIIIFQVMKNV